LAPCCRVAELQEWRTACFKFCLVNQALLCINPKCETTAGCTGLFCKIKEKLGVPDNLGFAEAINLLFFLQQIGASTSASSNDETVLKQLSAFLPSQ